MLSILGKTNHPDTFIMFMFNGLEDQSEGIAFHIEIAEKISEHIKSKFGIRTTVGIGRSYSGLKELKLSFHEALNALDYAANTGHNPVIHIDNVQSSISPIKYPYPEKEDLLFSVKLADWEPTSDIIDKLFPKIAIFANNDMMLLRMRVVELTGSIIDAAVASGGDERKCIEISKQYFRDLGMIKQVETLHEWFRSLVRELLCIISETHEKRDKRIIEENYMRQLKVEVVAN